MKTAPAHSTSTTANAADSGCSTSETESSAAIRGVKCDARSENSACLLLPKTHPGFQIPLMKGELSMHFSRNAESIFMRTEGDPKLTIAPPFQNEASAL